MENLGKNVFVYVLKKWNKIHKIDAPWEEKKIVYRMGNQVLDISRQFNNYTFNSTYNSMIKAFDLVCDRIQNGMNTPYDLKIIERLTENCEEIIACYEEAKELGKEIEKDISRLEKRVQKEKVQREKVLGKLYSNMVNQKLN